MHRRDAFADHMKRHVERWPVYPVLLTAVFLVGSWAESSQPLAILWRPLAIGVLGTVVIYVALIGVTRSRHLAALMSTGVVWTVTLQWHFAAVLLAVFIWWPSISLLRRIRQRQPVGKMPAQRLTPYLNMLGLILLAVATTKATVAIMVPNLNLPHYAVPLTNPAPNIYIVLLDGHPRLDTLQQEFGIDTSAFEDGLKSRHFVVSEDARSNYPNTWLSLTSMFNGAYVSDLGLPAASAPSDEIRLLSKAIDNGALLREFRSNGYKTVASLSAYADTDPRSADITLNGDGVYEWEQHLLQHSLIAGARKLVARSMLGDLLRDRIDNGLENISEIARLDLGAPKLGFVHILSPHPPFLFQADGSALALPDCYPGTCLLWQPESQFRDVTIDEYGEALTGELTYLHHRTLEAIDEVMEHDPQGVVIVMSDHGARYDVGNRAEYFRSLFAARTPGRNDVFSDDQSVVNVLRDLVSEYGTKKLPDLPYRAWVTEPGRPLHLVPFATH